MSGPYYGTHPYDPFRKDPVHVPAHIVARVAAHPRHPLRTQSTLLESSASAPNLRQFAKEQASEGSLPRGFLQPVPKSAKKFTAEEIEHRRKMRKQAWDKLTGGEPMGPDVAESILPALHPASSVPMLPTDVPHQPFPRAAIVRQNTGPPAPEVHYTTPYTVMVAGEIVPPKPANSYSNNAPSSTYYPSRAEGSLTQPVVTNFDRLPPTFQPYAPFPKTFQPIAGSTVLQDNHEFKAGSVVIMRKSSNARWKVGAFLSAEKYREVDGSEHYLYQAAPFRDWKGNAPRQSNYVSENISLVPSDDTPHITPRDKDKARSMLMTLLTKPPKKDSFLFAAFPTETPAANGLVNIYETWEPVMCLGDMLHNFGFSVLGLSGSRIGKKYVVYHVKPYCGWFGS